MRSRAFFFFVHDGFAVAEFAAAAASLLCVAAVDSGDDYWPSRLGMGDDGIMVRASQASLVELRKAIQHIGQKNSDLTKAINAQATAITILRIRLAASETRSSSGESRMTLIEDAMPA